MTRRRSGNEHKASVLVGRRLSRRAFLRAAAVSGLAAMGAAGATMGARRDRPVGQARVADQFAEGPIADLAAALGYDLESIYRFVADDVRYEPYTGVLRGASGTLAARAGNSADKAVLLGALLDASLMRYRFAVGALDSAAVDAVTAASRLSSDDLQRATAAALVGSIPGEALPPPPALDAASQAIVDAGAAAQEQVQAWALQQLSSTLSAIDEALGSTGIELPYDVTPVPLREIDQHVWVQVAQGTDWLDLDPTVPGTASGDALTSADGSLDALPDDLFHRIVLSVVGESGGPAGLTSATLLMVSERADVLAGLPITFLNASPTGVERLAQVVTPIAGVLSYLPTLVIGEEAFAGRPIRFGRPEGPADELLGGSDDILGGGAGEETTAEWLELTVVSPDRDPIVVRRAIFDRFGPAARAAGELDPTRLAPVQTVTLAGGSGPEVLPALASTWLSIGTGLPGRDTPVMRQGEADTGAPAALAHSQHLFREFGDLALAVPLGARSFADAPNVAAYTIAPGKGADEEPTIELVMDIWHRSRGVSPVVGEAITAPPATVAGVVDHIIERLLMGDALERAPEAPTPAVSVGAVFDAAIAQAIGMRVLADPSDAADMGYHPDAAAILAADLADGWVAIAPERPVTLGNRERSGWWLIDPASGRAIDRLDDGRGAEGIEFQATLTPGQLARETALQKLARDCLAGSAILLAVAVSSIASTVAVAEYADSRHPGWLALGVAGGAGGGGGIGGNQPMLRCLRAA